VAPPLLLFRKRAAHRDAFAAAFDSFVMVGLEESVRADELELPSEVLTFLSEKLHKGTFRFRFIWSGISPLRKLPGLVTLFFRPCSSPQDSRRPLESKSGSVSLSEDFGSHTVVEG